MQRPIRNFFSSLSLTGAAMIVGTIASTLATPTLAIADDACEEYCDYLCRHYKQDLRPMELRISVRNAGDFLVRSLALRIKNTGQVDWNQNEVERRFPIFVQGLGTRWVTIDEEIPTGSSKWVGLGGISNQIEHCDLLNVRIDTNRSAGQVGCGIYGNDSQNLRAVTAGRFCRFIPVNPLPPIQPIPPRP